MQQRIGEHSSWYCLLLSSSPSVVGDLVVIGLAWMVEQFSKALSLFVFLVLFLGMIPLAWQIAVRITEPEGPSPTTQ